jgi:hypothetical protein
MSMPRNVFETFKFLATYLLGNYFLIFRIDKSWMNDRRETPRF